MIAVYRNVLCANPVGFMKISPSERTSLKAGERFAFPLSNSFKAQGIAVRKTKVVVSMTVVFLADVPVLVCGGAPKGYLRKLMKFVPNPGIK